jgi:asparagine synthase (glutamine-hydrolysing)
MCGLAASFATENVTNADTLEALGRLIHRGPDGVGAASLGRATLAHARLAIVDVQGGHQPMPAERAGALLVCNGEIYNHASLRARLCSRHDFRTKSDSEVVLHLYEDLGAGCVTELDGMFAFFATDGERFTAARDPFGIKPLYFGTDSDARVWVASEMKRTPTGRDARYYRLTAAGRRQLAQEEEVFKQSVAVTARVLRGSES